MVAGLLGGFSAVTRTIGLLLVFPLAYEWAIQKPRRWRSILALVLIPLGLGLYMLYLDTRFGDPLIFSKAQTAWGRTISVGGAFARIQDLSTDPALAKRVFRSAFDIVTVLFGAAVLIGLLRKLRPSYIIYAAYCFLVPLATLQVLSMPRLLIVIFPLFIALSYFLHNPLAFKVSVGAFAILQVFLVARWSLWYWVA